MDDVGVAGLVTPATMTGVLPHFARVDDEEKFPLPRARSLEAAIRATGTVTEADLLSASALPTDGSKEAGFLAARVGQISDRICNIHERVGDLIQGAITPETLDRLEPDQVIRLFQVFRAACSQSCPESNTSTESTPADDSVNGHQHLLNLVGRICKAAASKTDVELLSAKADRVRNRVGHSRAARQSRSKGKSALLQAFKRVDKDRSGKLNRTEVGKAIQTLGYSLKPWEISLLLDSLDASGDGLVSYAEFADALVALAAEASVAAAEKAAELAVAVGDAGTLDFSSPGDAAN